MGVQLLILWAATSLAAALAAVALLSAGRSRAWVRLMAWAAKESRHEVLNEVAQLRARVSRMETAAAASRGAYPPIIAEAPRSRTPLPAQAVEQLGDAGDLAELPAGEGYAASAATLGKGGRRE